MILKKPQLFLLPFAGGNRYSFNFLLPFLMRFNTIVLELPGRGKRVDEPLITNHEEAAEDYFKQINKNLSSNDFIIYGHSMGAILGMVVTRMLEEINKFPITLIVSGNPGPGLNNNEKKNKYLLPEGEFILALRELGGAPEEMLQSKDLFAFFEPILRADFEVVEKNEITISNPLKTPIFAIMGSDEKKKEHIDNWSKYTYNTFRSMILEGDHFFIYKNSEQLGNIITTCYEKSNSLL